MVGWTSGLKRSKPSHLMSLTGLRPLTTQETTAQPVVENQAGHSAALRPVLPPVVATSQPATRKPAATQPVVILPNTPSHPRPATQPAVPKMDSKGNVLAKVVSPVTQPAVELPAGGAGQLLKEGLDLRKADKLVEARDKLNAALHNGVTVQEAVTAREALADIANRTIFSKTVLKDDPLVRWHQVTSGDHLGRIARKASVSEALLAQINQLRKPGFLREGSKLKIIQGPFHAAVCKQTHELHLYLQTLYVGTLRVALGQDGSTPTGLWRGDQSSGEPGVAGSTNGQALPSGRSDESAGGNTGSGWRDSTARRPVSPDMESTGRSSRRRSARTCPWDASGWPRTTSRWSIGCWSRDCRK